MLFLAAQILGNFRVTWSRSTFNPFSFLSEFRSSSRSILENPPIFFFLQPTQREREREGKNPFYAPQRSRRRGP